MTPTRMKQKHTTDKEWIQVDHLSVTWTNWKEQGTPTQYEEMSKLMKTEDKAKKKKILNKK